MRKGILAVSLFLLLAGCGTMNLQIKGAPIPNNVVEARVLYPPIQLTYALMHFYGEPEGDEVLETWKYLALVGQKDPHEIKMKNLNRLVLRLDIFNPEKEEYSLELIVVKENMQSGQFSGKVVSAYSGDLSRKTFMFEYPAEKDLLYKVKFQIYEGETLCYESFEAYFKFVEYAPRKVY